jgi:glycerol-3-phosphate dehydrogenase
VVQRELRRLADSHFDVVIVGAGFYGAIAAWDATLRGLSVALIDKGDFGGATSFNNLKTLHGGLRSLQSLNFRQMHLFIRERRALARVAPHLVHPLAFIVPTYRHPLRSAVAMRTALAINDAVSRDRHEGINDPALRLPPGRVVSRDECLHLNPLIDPAGVTGGAMWHDYQMDNTDRMTFSFVLSAAQSGAVVANYVQAIDLLIEGMRVTGVRARDVLTEDTFDIRASVVLNATGPWAATFLASLSKHITTPALRLSRAMNLVVRRSSVAQACGGRAAGRFLFLAPWRDVSLVGTSHDVHEAGPDALTVTRFDLEAFLADIREAFPLATLTKDDVRLVHRGLLPMVSGTERHVSLLRESSVVDHTRDGVRGLVSMFGVRYTTARATAEQAVNALWEQCAKGEPPTSRTATTPVYGGAIANKEEFMRDVAAVDVPGVSEQMLKRLAITYGTECRRLLSMLQEDPTLAAPLSEQCSVSSGEILYAIRNESAERLSDVLIRRTEAGSAGHPGNAAITRAAQIMSRERQWDEWHTRKEIAEVEAFYTLPS